MFDDIHSHVQTKEAAKIQAKSQEKIAKMQMKKDEIREKKRNQEGIYMKIGPFTIKTYLIIITIIILGIMMLVQKVKEDSSGNQNLEGVKQESVNNR